MPRKSGNKSNSASKSRNFSGSRNKHSNNRSNNRSGSTPAQLRARRENIRKAQEARRTEGRGLNLF